MLAAYHEGGGNACLEAAMKRPLRIALVMGQDSSFCRDVLGGIRVYAMNRKPWVFRNGPPRLEIIRPCANGSPTA